VKGRVVVVTGAASGIGRATAELLAAEGARVLAVDIDPEGEVVARGIEAAGAEVAFVQADLVRAGECEAVVSAALEVHGGIDALVNCAGVVRRATVLETSETNWDEVMDVNVKAVYLLARETIPVMIQRGGGAIVNIASGWGLAAGPRAAAYCASKGALVQLTKAMAIDHAAQGIRVNCVCPGDVDTPMLAREARELDVDTGAFYSDAADRPMGRIGSAAEIAQAVLFLVGDGSRYVSGASLVIDGGGLLG
jgi:NAD(P)-dependent dehydrogenase (short-subunit alcohol dehydrogenase family)